MKPFWIAAIILYVGVFVFTIIIENYVAALLAMVCIGQMGSNKEHYHKQ
jgi:hypothetical protein